MTPAGFTGLSNLEVIVSEKLSTNTVFRSGDLVHLHLDVRDDSGALFRVIYADVVGICVVAVDDNLEAYHSHPEYVPVAIEGSFFYPWASVEYIHLVMDSNTYVATYGGTN